MTDDATDRVPNLKTRSPVLLIVLGLAGAGLALGAGVVVFLGATAPPDQETVCAGLGGRLGARASEASAAIRASYPDDTAPPPPGSLVELVGGEAVADTPENLCRNMLYVWEHRLDRDPYGELVRCVDGSKTPGDIIACRKDLPGGN